MYQRKSDSSDLESLRDIHYKQIIFSLYNAFVLVYVTSIKDTMAVKVRNENAIMLFFNDTFR